MTVTVFSNFITIPFMSYNLARDPMLQLSFSSPPSHAASPAPGLLKFPALLISPLTGKGAFIQLLTGLILFHGFFSRFLVKFLAGLIFFNICLPSVRGLFFPALLGLSVDIPVFIGKNIIGPV